MNFAFLLLLWSGSFTPALASPENDRVYKLDTLGWLKASDNMDGVFAEYLDEQYSHYFSGQGRFLVKPLKGLSEVLGKSDAKYPELIAQPEILRKIALKYGVEGLLRSRVYKEGDSYRFQLEWVYAPKGDVVAQVEFRYLDEGKETGLRGSALSQAIEKHLNELVSKLPFLGEVTGVEDQTITISLGHNVGIKPKQIVTLYTLQSVKRHPLLHTIEEWRWQPIGRAQVEQVDATLSFAKVLETEPNVKVLQNQKVREVLEAPIERTQPDAEASERNLPKSGWVAGNLGIGSYSREVGVPSGTGKGGSGILGNFELDAQVWLNSRYIAQGSLGGSIFKYGPTNLSTGASQNNSYNGNETRFRFAFGYSLLPMKTVFDPIAWIHVGYRDGSASLATNTSDFTADSSLGSLFVGVGGEFPVYGGWLAQMGMDLGVIRTGDAASLNFGDASPSSDLTFRASACYPLNERFYFRAQFTLHSESMGFPSGQSLTQKLFSISPSLMYYF